MIDHKSISQIAQMFRKCERDFDKSAMAVMVSMRMDYAARRITYRISSETLCDESGVPMLKVPLNGL